jgi:phage recombination protein Bet
VPRPKAKAIRRTPPRRAAAKPKPKPVPTTALAVPPQPERPWELNNEQVVLLKNYLKIADSSDLELKACLEVARRYRLDPFKQGQIWFIKRWDKNAVSASGSKGAYIYTPQVGLYGMLHIASRDYKDFGSTSEAEFGPMFMHEVEGHKIKAPEWCRVKVYKKGVAEPTVATIYFEEFCPALWDNARLFWAKMPRAQIEKCAKARAIRTAYPDLGGLYIPEEMERFNEDRTKNGRQIVEAGGVQAAQAVAQRKIEAHKEGKTIDVAPEPTQVPETITITFLDDTTVALTGSGLAVAKSELSQEAKDELGVKHTLQKGVHMPAANAAKFIDRAAKFNVVAKFAEEPGASD